VFHFVLDGPKDWLPPWISAVASLLAVIAASVIAWSQSKLQRMLAERQNSLQQTQLGQQARQLKQDLFDRRFAVLSETIDFLSHVLRENGKIETVGPGPYRQFRDAMVKAEMLFGSDVNEYLSLVNRTVLELASAVKWLDDAIRSGNMDVINRHGELINTLSGRLWEQRTLVFRPYLDLSGC
jgi:hypothetical protein